MALPQQDNSWQQYAAMPGFTAAPQAYAYPPTMYYQPMQQQGGFPGGGSMPPNLHPAYYSQQLPYGHHPGMFPPPVFPYGGPAIVMGYPVPSAHGSPAHFNPYCMPQQPGLPLPQHQQQQHHQQQQRHNQQHQQQQQQRLHVDTASHEIQVHGMSAPAAQEEQEGQPSSPVASMSQAVNHVSQPVATPSADAAVLSYAKRGGGISAGPETGAKGASHAGDAHEQKDRRRSNFNQLLSQAFSSQEPQAPPLAPPGDGTDPNGRSDVKVEQQQPRPAAFDVAAGAAELGSRWREVQAAGDVEFA